MTWAPGTFNYSECIGRATFGDYMSGARYVDVATTPADFGTNLQCDTPHECTDLVDVLTTCAANVPTMGAVALCSSSLADRCELTCCEQQQGIETTRDPLPPTPVPTAPSMLPAQPSELYCTGTPTVSPTMPPSSSPTGPPSALPSPHPSVSPTSPPTFAPSTMPTRLVGTPNGSSKSEGGSGTGSVGMSPGTIAGIVLIIILGIILLRIILGIIWLRSRRREEQDGPAKPLPAAETFMEVDDAVTTTTTAAASNTTANAGYHIASY